MKIFTLSDSYKDNSYGVEDDDGRIIRYFQTKDEAKGWLDHYNYGRIASVNMGVRMSTNFNGDDIWGVFDYNNHLLHTAYSYEGATDYIQGRSLEISVDIHDRPIVKQVELPEIDLKDVLK